MRFNEHVCCSTAVDPLLVLTSQGGGTGFCPFAYPLLLGHFLLDIGNAS